MTMRKSDYSLPAEWASQSGVMLTWPHAYSDWSRWLHQVEPVFVEIARQISLREMVLVVCRNNEHKSHVVQLLADSGADLGQIHLVIAPSNDTWARDHGPITVLEDDRPVLLDFVFDGWGGKYDSDLDNRITTTTYVGGAFGKAPLRSIDFVLEGGGIESDGLGTLMTTESCLLYGKRNPGCTREQIEQKLQTFFGVTRVLWLKHGYLAGDDTDGHIDTLARFCNPETIAYVSCDNEQDEHAAALRAMRQDLKGFTRADGTPYTLVPLPLPKPIHDAEGHRLPATYANFLIINGAVLVPVYRDPSDRLALERLAACFPDREIIGIDCVPLIYQYGSLHCVTMQLPAGILGGVR
jgi:agmatine deiminase